MFKVIRPQQFCFYRVCINLLMGLMSFHFPFSLTDEEPSQTPLIGAGEGVLSFPRHQSVPKELSRLAVAVSSHLRGIAA